MKNILIIETCQDNQGANTAFFPDIKDIADDLMREAVTRAIDTKFKYKRITGGSTSYDIGPGIVYSEGAGCYFANLKDRIENPPFTVEHIVHHIIT